jgi:tRNA uridine 5-carboxymethylaminomethyl modification enzyme
LRQSNADQRLTPISHKIGLASEERFNNVSEKMARIAEVVHYLKKSSVEPDIINGFLEESQTAAITQKMKISGLLGRPQISLAGLANYLPSLKNHLNTIRQNREEILEEAEILIKYEGYIEKEDELARKLERLESVTLKENFDYHRLTALSFEAREKLTRIKPRSLGQASRIAGVSPADISILIVHLGR